MKTKAVKKLDDLGALIIKTSVIVSNPLSGDRYFEMHAGDEGRHSLIVQNMRGEDAHVHLIARCHNGGPLEYTCQDHVFEKTFHIPDGEDRATEIILHKRARGSGGSQYIQVEVKDVWADHWHPSPPSSPYYVRVQVD
ncbi:hypothetical protein ACFVHB_30165 [Kitasatospora sp. NPDC127111]|uniref:hypothetical protein n=1 Tax=Kitasatospora sp. NPDC127111 TaxID=3345363 RepID=UPI00363DAB76